MENTDIKTYAQSDSFYLEQIGEFVRASRIAQQQTQEDIALAAGIDRTTVVKLEKGQPVNLLSLVQVLRALKQLHVFKEMEVRPQVSPLKMAAVEQKQRLRVRRKATPGTDRPQSDW
ncbi:MAG: helix-turn-helix domain-containing protein [Bacteroidota bacterium]